MIIKTRTSTYEAKLEGDKITLEKIAITEGKTSNVEVGKKEEGECLVITTKGVFLYKENFIPGGSILTRGVVKLEGKEFSPEAMTTSPREI